MDADIRRLYYCLGRLGQGKTACPSGKQFVNILKFDFALRKKSLTPYAIFLLIFPAERDGIFWPSRSLGQKVCAYLRAACRGEASCEDGSAVKLINSNLIIGNCIHITFWLKYVRQIT